MIERVTITDVSNQIKELNTSSHLTRCVFMEWIFDDKKGTFSADKQKNQLFIPTLSPNREEFILFLKDYPEFSSPCDVVILNEDGTIRHHICPPEMISEQYKRYEEKAGKKESLASINFIQPATYNISGKEVFTVWVGFGWDWYEVRELDLKTGVFGKCLRVARL